MHGKVALIGQDALRRDIFMERDSLDNTDVLGLLEQTVNYCFEKGYDVILEGILGTQKYLPTIQSIISHNNCATFTFYMDVTLEETIRRHATKPVAAEFGEEKIREWYKPNHYLGLDGEIIIPENLSIGECVDLIQKTL